MARTRAINHLIILVFFFLKIRRQSVNVRANMFKPVDSKMDLPKTEAEVLDFWDANKIFEKSLDQTKNGTSYSFYDGPPFATGTPHYGHIVGSTMKDVVPRYWTMKGYHVPRVWGWDCHGLPIENIAEKELGITHKKQIEEIGVKKFNDTCRSKVLEYTAEWKNVIHRLGRWADMDNAYKTMDRSYMESVWWVFKQLWDKKLIYESYRSMYICPRCETTLSQSEVAEGYRMIKDLSVTAKFELVDEPGTFILAWTTTPWTLIGNVALAVGAEIEYVKVSTESQVPSTEYILAKEALERYKDELGEYKIIDQFKGADLVGKAVKPLFGNNSKNAELPNRENGWKVYAADFVVTEEGTGVVHIATAFGEDDMNLGKKFNLPFIQHINMDGIIKEGFEFAGLSVKPIDDVQSTDVEIIKYLAGKNLLFAKEKYEHSYPHCWRCETPLLNFATTSWFINITQIKEQALEQAQKINWSPKHIKEGRFGNWLTGARDWSISRQRYWASAIPIWKCEKCSELKVVGSVSELGKLSGQEITDLHKENVDPIKFSCQSCDGSMKRIPDVLDCWFESGSMPYAQFHYPFENTEQAGASFPADFIAEGIDQTRTWFYYLHAIATAIKGEAAFKNVIVNGTVLAEDGKKMSKRLQNYPDPMLMFDKYGADVLRLYLLTSPVMQAENVNFNEKELAEHQRGIFRMLWNSYSFFVLYANIDKWEAGSSEFGVRSSNILDQWIISELNVLIENVNESMEKYELTQSARLFAPFVDDLSNWYIRRCRKRFWKADDSEDKNSAYHTLYEVLVTLSKLMAPFTPFMAEDIYKNLTGEESVHLAEYPKANPELIDKELTDDMTLARKVIELGLSARAQAGIKVRQPLLSIRYHGKQLDQYLEAMIADELNLRSILFEPGDANTVDLDTEISEDLKLEGFAREIIRNIQTLRKESGFQVENRIELFYETNSELLNQTFAKYGELISHETLAEATTTQKTSAEGESDYKIDSDQIWIGIKRI